MKEEFTNVIERMPKKVKHVALSHNEEFDFKFMKDVFTTIARKNMVVERFDFVFRHGRYGMPETSDRFINLDHFLTSNCTQFITHTFVSLPKPKCTSSQDIIDEKFQSLKESYDILKCESVGEHECLHLTLVDKVHGGNKLEFIETY